MGTSEPTIVDVTNIGISALIDNAESFNEFVRQNCIDTELENSEICNSNNILDVHYSDSWDVSEPIDTQIPTCITNSVSTPKLLENCGMKNLCHLPDENNNDNDVPLGIMGLDQVRL